MAQTAEAFWEAQYDLTQAPQEPAEVVRAVEEAIEFFGPMQGKRVLDIGCGMGGTSIMLARIGGEVTGVDLSHNAVDYINKYARANSLGNLKAVYGDAMKIDALGEFDFVFGSLILHHLEPFGDFCSVLRRTLRPGGRAFFLENNAASDLLVWFRKNIVGKLWVPRYGDGVEFPLTPAEVGLLRRQFKVEIQVPEMMFFQLASVYLLKRRMGSLAKSMDDFMFRHNLGTRYSYRQYVKISG